MKPNNTDKNKIAGITLFIILMLLLILKIVFKNP
jgi:Tfp pilus assembly protein PilX